MPALLTIVEFAAVEFSENVTEPLLVMVEVPAEDEFSKNRKPLLLLMIALAAADEFWKSRPPVKVGAFEELLMMPAPVKVKAPLKV